MTELRPCIVHIPELKDSYRVNKSDEIKTVIIRPAKEYKGYFHKWADRYWTIGQSPMVGGYSAGQMSETVAIVEYEDGSVHEIPPGQIQFADKEQNSSSKLKELSKILGKCTEKSQKHPCRDCLYKSDCDMVFVCRKLILDLLGEVDKL